MGISGSVSAVYEFKIVRRQGRVFAQKPQ